MGALALKQGARRFEDGVWRIRDIDLAVYLGMAQPRNLRARIKRSIDALEEFGPIRRTTEVRPEGGADVEEFWLNKKQAYFIVARGETKQADELLIVLVDTFGAFERGELIPSESTVEMVVLDREKNEIAHRFAQLEGRQMRIEGKVDRVDEKVDRVGEKVDRMDGKLDTLHAKTDQVLECQQHRRKDVSFRDEMKHQACVQHRWGGICPCCHVVRIVNADGTRTTEFEIDHYSGRHQPGLTDTWAVCHSCNMKLRNGGFHRSKFSEFQAYQNTLAAFKDPGPLFRDLYE
jgi:hypothetical protein